MRLEQEVERLEKTLNKEREAFAFLVVELIIFGSIAACIWGFVVFGAYLKKRLKQEGSTIA